MAPFAQAACCAERAGAVNGATATTEISCQQSPKASAASQQQAFVHPMTLSLSGAGCGHGAAGGECQRTAHAATARQQGQPWASPQGDARLAQVASALAARCGPSLAVVQVWSSRLGSNLDSLVMLNSTELALTPTYQAAPCPPDMALINFLERSRTSGITGKELGAIGKVWSKGHLQIVQSVSNLPSATHPRSKLGSGADRHVGGVVHIPVYDTQVTGPASRVVAMLEVLVSSDAVECMVVAHVISVAAELLQELQLSISQPPAVPPPPARCAASAIAPPRKPDGAAAGAGAMARTPSMCRSGSVRALGRLDSA